MDFGYIKTTAANIFNQISTQNFLVKSIIAIWMFFTGIHVYIYAVFLLTLIDVITGTIASIKRGEAFKSKILKKGLVEKFFLYILIMIAVFVLETVAKSVIKYTAFYFVSFAAFSISCYELISILENIISINPKLTFVTSFINLTNRLQTTATDKANKAIDDVKVDKD